MTSDARRAARHGCCTASGAGRRAGARRRGVLLLVVLSLLVLFMLIGTAFLMSSNQFGRASESSAQFNRVGNYPTKLLDRAVMQVLRDTNNPRSAVRYHSLLRDMYGADGFEATVYSPENVNLATAEGQVSRFAAATNGSAAQQLGPTQGQLIDLYVRQLAFNPATAKSADDPLTPNPPTNENVALNAPDARHVLKLEKDVNGQPQVHPLPLTKGYYNGCLLTITSGPATGQSTRIIEYEYVGDLPTLPASVGSVSRLFRFRVMAFPRADGTPLQINAARAPELGDLAGATFVVNGRPFNGTGVGYNPLATPGMPRLGAVEVRPISASQWIGAEIALLPNSAYFVNLPSVYAFTNPAADPFLFLHRPTHFAPLNPDTVPPVDLPTRWKYPSFVGFGDTDESYDAADFQNMFLALQTVTPRPRGRVVHNLGGAEVVMEVDDPRVVNSAGTFVNAGNFLRLDLEDLPMPSFHRPDLINFWYHRMLNSRWLSDAIPDASERAKAVLQPFDADGNLAPWVPSEAIAGQITAIKRRISLRPTREDHPNFDGGNPSSRPRLTTAGTVVDQSERNIGIPYWEAVGPWDVDNDNDGVPDSVWVDLGDPVAQAEDGTLYKPLYAFLILDLDGRLNVNAHGLVDDLRLPNLDVSTNSFNGHGQGNLAHQLGAIGLNTSNYLPHGVGYGPAEISLRPVLSPRLPGSALANRVGDNGASNPVNADDYARLLVGRPAIADSPAVWGRHGLDLAPNFFQTFPYDVAPGIAAATRTHGNQFGPPGLQTQLKFFGYPERAAHYWYGSYVPTAFGSPPDLMGRYALGLDYIGQPVNEVVAEFPVDRPLVADSPYELNLSGDRRRDVRADRLNLRLNQTTGQTEYVLPSPNVPSGIIQRTVPGIVPETDDAPFAAADLERLLRAFDADAGLLPDRLWNLVDAFDPVKLHEFQPLAVDAMSQELFGSVGTEPERLAAAQTLAAINRRLVTTDSYDLPVPGQNMPAYAAEAGPDGQPGRAGLDDDGANGVDDPAELAAPTSDDFRNIVGRDRAQASLLDLLRYRVWTEFRRAVMRENNWDEAALIGLNSSQYAAFLNEVTQRTDAVLAGNPAAGIPPLVDQILAPEVIAGKRMDINRPFGDGRDNAGNGRDDNNNGLIDEPGEPGDPFNLANAIVDDPLEAGEPFLDLNGNGKWDNGEPYIDMLKNGAGGRTGAYDGPRDQLWPELTNPANGPIHEPIVFDYTNGVGVPLHEQVRAAGNYPPTARVRNLDSQGRQLYARHLYCLMMLLMDEGYIELPDAPSLGGDNVNLEWYLQIIAERRGNADPTPADIELATRKLTARRVAQWAINCVDFRDADAIMTPFEYDENPWDGWGVWRHDTANNTHEFIPLDGDPATNENGNDLMPEAELAANNMAQVIDWDATANNNEKIVSNTIARGPATIADQSRGLVWGAERPELLITETLAFHDRRATDEAGDSDNLSITDPLEKPPGSDPPWPDYDLDQRLKPRGSLFVELYNPWTADGLKPAELYSQVDPVSGAITPTDGIMLNRLSDYSTLQNGVQKRSPVWRMVVLRDPLNGRLMNTVINVDDFDKRTAAGEEIAAYALQLLSTDIDGYGLDSDFACERYVYFTTGGDTNREDDNRIEAPPGTPGEYELIGGNLVPRMDHLAVRVPPLPYRLDAEPGSGVNKYYPEAHRYFIARTQRHADTVTTPNSDADVAIAPILPGRYGVIGSSGLQLDAAGQARGVAARYVTPIGRKKLASSSDQTDDLHLLMMGTNRRIELWPSPNPADHQLRIAENGGPEFVRKGGSVVNVTDANPGAPLARPVPAIIDPVVAVPVEDLNISEPVEGYPSLHYQKLHYELTGTPVNIPPLRINAFGEQEFETIFDRPLDLEFELVRNGTTQNYRSLHLQRLANPTLPWNPPPIDATGTPNPMHQRHLPVNPYLTIDSQSVDLTAFNGASALERTLPTAQAEADGQLQTPTSDASQGEFFSPLVAEELIHAPKHVLWAVARLLKQEGYPSPYTSIGQMEQFREYLKTSTNEVQGYLDDMEQKRGANIQDLQFRQLLNTSPRVDQYGRVWDGQWGWHIFRRSLPDDDVVNRGNSTLHTTGEFRQRLHLKSLERGAHHRWYDYPSTNSLTAYNIQEGWKLDFSWVPRLLWKQERPNVTLFLKRDSGETKKVTDLKNVKSHRVIKAANLGAWPPDEVPPPLDEQNRDAQIRNQLTLDDHVINFVVEQTLGFANESYAPELDRNSGADEAAMLATGQPRPGAPEVAVAGGTPDAPANPDADSVAGPPNVTPGNELGYTTSPRNNPPNPSQLPVRITNAEELERRQFLMRSTFPWFTWNNRPFVSADELTQVPAWSSSLMLRNFSVINQFTPNPYDGDGKTRNPDGSIREETAGETLAIQQAPYGHLLNFFTTWINPSKVTPPTAPGGAMVREGAPHYYRLLDYVEVPSRYVGTESVLSPDVFNDNPLVNNDPAEDILDPMHSSWRRANPLDPDPRHALRPPFNNVSLERDPGRVNLNTVLGRRTVVSASLPPQIWSDVYDGIMHRYRDGSLVNVSTGNLTQLGHFGPAWRDVVLSRKGYAQFNANDPNMNTPLEKRASGAPPDVFTFGLNPGFPTVFANPFRAASAGDLVPLRQMMQYGVDASWMRVHPWSVGNDGRWGIANADGDGFDNDNDGTFDEPFEPGDPSANGLIDDALEAGFGDDRVSHRGPNVFRAIPEDELYDNDRNGIPLFSEPATAPAIDGTRNPYMLYQPMTRLGNLVTTRSNVYAIWVTVGYFELEPAPAFVDVQERFGGDGSATAANPTNNAVNAAAKALYDRVYPEGYRLGAELGSDTGNTKRQRAFYIIDRTEPVGFKPGDDLNVEQVFRVRRRIE